MKAVYLVFLLLSANALAQNYPCNCGMHDTFVLHPQFIPEEGLPFRLEILQEEPGRFVLRLQCDHAFLKDIILKGVSVRIADRDLPEVAGEDFRPYLGWCMSAQRGAVKAVLDLSDSARDSGEPLMVPLSAIELSRGFLTIYYDSDRKSKTYWIPLELQKKKRPTSRHSQLRGTDAPLRG